MELVSTPRLPGSGHRPTREEIAASQRGRVIDAMAEAVAAKGYGDTAVADVVATAGISRRTFYEHFSNKEECFLATYDVGAEILLAEIARAAAGAGDVGWRERLSLSLDVALGALAAEPAFARAFSTEVLAAGPRALERRAAVLARFTDQYRALYALAQREEPSLAERSDAFFTALFGGIAELVMDRVRTDGPQGLPSLAPALREYAVAAMTGRSD